MEILPDRGLGSSWIVHILHYTILYYCIIAHRQCSSPPITTKQTNTRPTVQCKIEIQDRDPHTGIDIRAS